MLVIVSAAALVLQWLRKLVISWSDNMQRDVVPTNGCSILRSWCVRIKCFSISIGQLVLGSFKQVEFLLGSICMVDLEVSYNWAE